MLKKFAPIVKQQIEYWKYQVAHFGPDHPRYRPTKIAKYEHLIREFSELLDRLNQAEGDEGADHAVINRPVERRSFSHGRTHTVVVEPRQSIIENATPTSAASATRNDLADLPPELLAELSESTRAETDPLIKIINERGGTATLDEILIDLYRKFGEIGKRNIIANKLYRLSKRGLCKSLPGKKGLYTTDQVVDPAKVGSENPSDENDGGTSDPSSERSGSGDEPARRSSASTKPRRDLFASTVIPLSRLPQ